MHKRNIISIIIMSLLMTSFVFGLDFPTDSSDQEIVDNDSLVISDPDTSNSITSSTDWFSGETVKSNIEFNKQTASYETLQVSDRYDVARSFLLSEWNRWALVVDDYNHHYIEVDYEGSAYDIVYVEINVKLYCGGSGTLSYGQNFKQRDAGGTHLSDQIVGTFDIESSDLDSQGYLNLIWWLKATDPSNELEFSLSFYGSGGSTNIFSDVTDIPIIQTEYVALMSDYFYFIRDTIENQIRSEYQYVSDTMLIHSLTIPSVSFSKEINVYSPTHWTYSSVNPSATVSTVDSDHTITSPTELTYEMIFTSNSTYLLAIEDVTSTYLQDIGFENGDWRNDWLDYSDGFDTIEIDTSISAEGYHSVKLSDTDGSTDYFRSKKAIVPAGYYYFSFSYYIESFSGSYFDFMIRQNSEYQVEHLDTSITNRWETVFVAGYTEGLSGGAGSCWDFKFSTAQGVVFIDNFRLFVPSTTIDTVDLDTYDISATFISWDGYQNPTVENEYVYMRFLDRTTRNDWMGSSEGLTDENGLFTSRYEGTLNQFEYEIMSYAKNSWWQCAWSPYYLTQDSSWTHSNYGTVVQTITDEYAHFHTDHVSTHDLEYYQLDSVVGSWDLSENNILLFDFKNSPDSKFESIYLRRTWADGTLRHHPNDVGVTSWTAYDYWFDRTHYWYNDENVNDDFYAGSAIVEGDLATMEQIHFSDFNTTDSATDFYIRNLHTTRAVSFYFTPSYPYHIDYAETDVTEDILDEWDFSEGDEDGWDSYVYCSAGGVMNGFHNTSHTSTTSDYFSIYSQDGLSIDTDYYTKAVIRLKIDNPSAGSSWKWYFVLYTPNYEQQNTPAVLTESWQIFTIDLKPSRTAVKVRLYIYEANDDPTKTVQLNTDYVRLVHVEEEEHYITDNFIGIGSENDQWISAVYSDDIYLGNYADPLLVYYNGTIGDHTISWLPLDRKNEIKAYLHSDLYEYHYKVSLADNYFLLLNPPSFDVAAGLVYLDIVTFWGNTTYRCKDNSTWLGSAVAEGSSVWSFNPTPGHHVFTVEIYNGEDTWFTLTSSITIAEPEDPPELTLLFVSKDVDIAAGLIYFNYYTNWGNTTLIVFDNTTQLGTELSGEGASIWSFSQVEYYAFHNISICIYHDSVLEFTYYFSFVIQEPLQEEGLIIEIWNKDVDIANKLISVNIRTNWQNQSIRIFDNSTELTNGYQLEGAIIVSFENMEYYAFHNISICLYNNLDLMLVEYFSFSIIEPIPEEPEELQLLFLTKDVDTSVSQIFVNYYTNWENTSLIVFDNTTQLGAELSGEGASIWSFSQVEYYAFHNISICIYHDSVLEFTYYFSFTIQPALEPDNYYTLLNPPSFDIDAGLIYIDLCTYYGNCTYRVMMNETFLGDAVNEGSSVWSCDFSQAGFYNFTVFVYQGATVWSTLTSSITIAEPAAPEGLIIEIWNKDVDVAAGLIYINVITSWGNQSVRLQDNLTWLGDYTAEGASIWLFPTTFGLHNISIWLYNDLTPTFVEYFSFTIQEPSLEIFTVHFDLFTIAGIGLPFETAKIYVNDSRIYNPQQYYLEDSFIEVKVRDYYNHLLFATNATITANRDIALYVRLFGQQIRNTYKIPIEVYFISTFDSNYNHSYVVAAEGSISVLLFSSSYHVLVKPLQDEYQNSTHVTYFYATTSEYQDLGDETKSYTISMETDLEPLDLEEPQEVRVWPAWVIAASAIFINAILISFIGAMGKWGIVKIWNYGLYYPNKGANWILRKFRSERELHWCVEHKGGLEFVTPEQHKKAEALKKEGQF